MAGEVEGGMGDSSGCWVMGVRIWGPSKVAGQNVRCGSVSVFFAKPPGRKGARAKRASRPRGHLSTLVGTTRWLLGKVR